MSPSYLKYPYLAMVVIGLGELMATLDHSIVNVALPSAQMDLGFDDSLRSWIISVYALAFGSLLPLGGALVGRFGQRQAFMLGLVGFAAASVLGGLAQSFVVLVAGRAIQGMFAALLAPAALSLLITCFDGRPLRRRAFGVFAMLAISGAAIGMILGGILTQYLDWRWCMLINAVFAAIAQIGAWAGLPTTAPIRDSRIDIAGAVTSGGGLSLLLYAFSNAETQAWTSPIVTGCLLAGCLLLAVFIAIERRVQTPLVPLTIFQDRSRNAAFLAAFTAVLGLFGVMLLLTYELQRNLGFGPLQTGFGFLPMAAGLMISATLTPVKLLPHLGARVILAGGLLLAAVALILLSFTTSGLDYRAVLAPLVILGSGLGATISTSIETATRNIPDHHAGVAAAVTSAVQQIGGAFGAALLAGIAHRAGTAPELGFGTAVLRGFDVAMGSIALLFVLVAAVTWVLRPGHRQRPYEVRPEPSTFRS